METTGGTWAIYLMGIIIGGLVTLVAMIFTIISLANGKKNATIIWGSSFVVALIILILSIISMVRGVVEKTKETGRNMKEWIEEQKYDDYNDYGDTSYWLDTLDFYVRSNVRPTVPEDFYNKDREIKLEDDGSVIAPFIYPYSVKFSPDNYGVADIINNQNDSLFVRNVLAMAFDENFVIAKLDNKGSIDLLKAGSPEIEYVLFDMRTGEYMAYKNEELLHEFADRIGYIGSLKMDYLSSKYAVWLDVMDFGMYE